MNHYIDIRVLPDPEFSELLLMNALYAKCHRVLGQLGGGEVGVSFPFHNKTLGSVLRLHATDKKLTELMMNDWLKGLKDYSVVSDLLETPDSVQFRTVQRVMKKSPHNMRKRSIAKGWLTSSEAEIKIKDGVKHILKFPFANMTSLSNKNPYKVFIKHGELQKNSNDGAFSSFGLSKTATIPWF